MREKTVVLGAGGHAKVVLDIMRQRRMCICGLTDSCAAEGENCLGYPILGTDDKLPLLLKEGVVNAAVGIGHVGDPTARNSVYAYAKGLGFRFPNLFHPSAVISVSCKMQEGIVVAPKAVINADAAVGNICIINTSAVVEHDAFLEDGVHIAPGAVVLGGAFIGENTFVGAGSVVLQGIRIGKNCVIGAGSVVLQDIEDDCVAAGTPARVIKRRLP